MCCVPCVVVTSVCVAAVTTLAAEVEPWVEPVEFKGFGVCEENVLAAALIQATWCCESPLMMQLYREVPLRRAAAVFASGRREKAIMSCSSLPFENLMNLSLLPGLVNI